MQRLPVLVLFLLATALGAQEMTAKKDLSIFRIGGNSPSSEGADALVQKVFVDLGRFEVLALPQDLGADGVNAFLKEVKAFREANFVLPQSVSINQQVFTEADFRKLIGSFLIVVPTFGEPLVRNGKDRLEATLEAQFTFIDGATQKIVADLRVTGRGFDKSSRAQAERKAVESIPAQLADAVRRVPQFQIATTITDFQGPDAVLEFGRNRGLNPGDEYLVKRPATVGGYDTEVTSGLLVVQDVQNDFSVARIIWADPAARMGDQLRELPHLGVDLSLSPRVLLGSAAAVSGVFTATGARGFSVVRPLAGLEVFVPGTWSGPWLPVSAFVGAEVVWGWGRLSLASQADVGVVASFRVQDASSGQAVELSHLKMTGQVRAAYRLWEGGEGFVTGGWSQGLALTSSPYSLSGPLVSAGLTFKP